LPDRFDLLVETGSPLLVEALLLDLQEYLNLPDGKSEVRAQE